jgi:hypothetical protein
MAGGRAGLPPGLRAGAVADALETASTAHALNSTFSDTEAETALNALGTAINAVADQLNDLLAELRSTGIIAT